MDQLSPLSSSSSQLLPSAQRLNSTRLTSFPSVQGFRKETRQLRVAGALKDWRSSGNGRDPSSNSRGSGSLSALDPSARRRLETAWNVQQQPVPVACESCCAEGMRECEWCNGSGYFVLGDKMLCEVPSRNTKCLVCHGQGSVRCSDCLGTGFRARWLESVLERKR